ncbi:uncharacterized protein ACB057_018630 [Neosynchiropus ocellatus]
MTHTVVHSSLTCEEGHSGPTHESIQAVFDLQPFRPAVNLSNPTVTNISFTLYAVLGVNEKTQILSTFLWLRLYWHHEFLVWDPDHCDGVTRISLPVKQLWSPDIIVYEFVDDDVSQACPYVYVNHTGHIRWDRMLRLVSACNLKIFSFPFDVQNCTFTFGSYMHTIRDVRVSPALTFEEMSGNSKRYLEASGEWELVDILGETSILQFGIDEWDIITFWVVIKRRPVLYVVNLLIPSSFLMLIDILSFYLPPHSVDRASFKMTLILGYTVFLLIMNDLLPSTANGTPIIGIYFSVCLALMVISLLETVIITNVLHHNSMKYQEVPQWVRVVVLKHVANLICYRWQDAPPPVRPHGDKSEEEKGSSPGAPAAQQPSGSDESSSTAAVGAAELQQICQYLGDLRGHLTSLKKESELQEQWCHVGYILDFLLFRIYLLLISCYALVIVSMWCIWISQINPDTDVTPIAGMCQTGGLDVVSRAVLLIGSQKKSVWYFCYNSELCHIQKYADDTAIVGCIRDDREEEYRRLVRDFAAWSRPRPRPVLLEGAEVEAVDSCKYLGLWLDNKLDWTTHTSHLYRKTQSRMYFLRRLRSFNICSKLLQMFYQSVVASVLFYTVVRAGSVVGKKLDSLVTVAELRTLDKLLDIMDNASHPLHTIISNQRSLFSERLLLPKCRTNRLKNSFQAKDERLLSVADAAVLNCSSPTPEGLVDALERSLFTKKLIRPVERFTDTVNVTVGITVVGILGVNEKEQTLKIFLWQILEWKIAGLSWDADECGTERISVPRENLWIPDIQIAEFMEEDKSKKTPYVYLNNTGDVFDAKPLTVVSTCRLNIYTFPFDIQNCTLTFESYLHFASDIRMVQGASAEAIVEESKQVIETNGEWQLLTVQVVPSTLVIDGGTYSSVKFHLIIKRSPLLYVVNLLIPSCFLSSLDLFSFLLPPQSVDRGAFKMTLILGYTVFLLLMNDLLPDNGETTPLINVLFSVSLALMVASLLETVFITNIQFSSSQYSEVPEWLSTLVLRYMAVLVCVPPKKNINRLTVSMHAPAIDNNLTTAKVLSTVSGEMQNVKPTEDVLLRELRKISGNLAAIRVQMDQHFQGSKTSKEWHTIGIIIDRLLFGIYIIFMTSRLADPDAPHGDDDQSVAGNEQQVNAEEQEVQDVADVAPLLLQLGCWAAGAPGDEPFSSSDLSP